MSLNQYMTDDFPMILEQEVDPIHGACMPGVNPVLVGFGLHPMLDSKATADAGHEVYVEVEHVKIAIPGDRNSLFFQPSTDIHRKRFPKAYEAYKNREREPQSGTPIETWPPISRSMALTLKAANIPTVEALANVAEGQIDRLGHAARGLREQAKAFLEKASDSAAVLKLAAEKKALEDRLAAMQEQINALGSIPAKPADDAASARKQRPRAS